MRTWSVLSLPLAALLAAALPLARAEPPAVQVPAGIEGGTAMPAGAAKIVFPWMGKQSLTATSDAFERMVAQVDFSTKKETPLGTVALDGKGGGSGEFAVQVLDLRTGDGERDKHLQSGQWLDAAKFPDLKLTITKLEQVKPTAFRMEGSWTMHGVTNPISGWANVRYLPEMMYLGKDIVRVKCSLTVSLKAHGLSNPAIGTPAVADLWTVDVVALGLMQK